MYGAPPVPSDLDVSKIVDDPCGALTKEQVDEFPGTLDDTDTAQAATSSEKKTACNWNFRGDRYSYGGIIGGVVIPSDTHQGLRSLYKTQQLDSYDTFEPVELTGYPALIHGDDDTFTENECRLSVGLRDDTAYRITADPSSESPDYDEPCEAAKRLGKFVVQNLKEGN